MSARISAAQRRTNDAATALTAHNHLINQLTEANNRAADLASANLLLQQQIEESVTVSISQPNVSTVQQLSVPTVDTNLPPVNSGDQLLVDMRRQLEVANKRLRDFEEQSEFERKRKALRDELACVTKRLLDLENNNWSTSSNVEVNSSSVSGVQTQLTPSASLNPAVLSGTSSITYSISTLGYTGLANQLGVHHQEGQHQPVHPPFMTRIAYSSMLWIKEPRKKG